MNNEETIVESANRLEHFVNKLYDAGHTTYDLEKRCTPLCVLQKYFAVVARVVRMSDKTFPDAVSQPIVQNGLRDEGETWEKRMVGQN